MPHRRQLSRKLLHLGLSLLLLALLSVATTLWLTRELDGGAAAVNEAGRLRMQAWRLASQRYASSDAATLALLERQVDASLDLLRRGDAARPLSVPWNAGGSSCVVA